MAEASTLDRELKAYAAHLSEFEDQTGKFVLIHDSVVVGIFETFDSAASHAVARFGRGPYLIRQIGQTETALPASVVYATMQAV